VCLALLLGILFPLGHALAQLRDATGSKDHPLIKRFEGSTILGYEFLKFNDFVVLLGPVRSDDENVVDPILRSEFEASVYRVDPTARVDLVIREDQP